LASYLSTAQVAAALGVSRERVRALVLEAKLRRAGTIGKTWLFHPREVKRYIRRRAKQQPK
jgi:excisionase family DNA binding protein